jgi:hypothetical protein
LAKLTGTVSRPEHPNARRVPEANVPLLPERVVNQGYAQLRPVDWAALTLLGFEVPSLWFSQYRANSVWAAQSVAVAVLVYFLLRLLMPVPVRAAWLSAVLGLSGAWLASVGILQFAAGTEQLAAVGLTDFVAFRSRFIHPIHGWVPGECFTVLLLALPFACAASAYLWRVGFPKRRFGLALFA